MILRMLILVLTLGCIFTSPSFAGTERGSGLVGEVGGIAGATGIPGVAGLAGIAGVAGTSAVLDFADFYLFDNDGVYPGGGGILAGVAVPFPHAGATSAGGITPIGGPSFTSFNLAAVGTYLVQFEVTASNAGQLQLSLNGAYIADSVVGRATGQTQLIGVSLLTTTTVNSVLQVVNPPANTVLTFPATGTSITGGANITDHLSIMRIQ